MKTVLTAAAATALVCGLASAEHHESRASAGAEAVVQSIYAAFAAGDIPAFTARLGADIVWNEADNFPYADGNPYEGPDAVMAGVFGRIGADWDGFAATPDTMIVDGNEVAVMGRYTGTHRETGNAIDAQFVHVWTIVDGQAVTFQQYTDTWQVRTASGLD
ncbi:nuclear transport factor 2 family protein [Maricaulis sp.]|uniref:nuclear transport factor 2 family protein n=1 Tax=Maricaulis sp. TaxID=1486257 RepID=UPI002635ED41|nr:nuclear transport factor 2 family protein [Maricaulis sp.]